MNRRNFLRQGAMLSVGCSLLPNIFWSNTKRQAPWAVGALQQFARATGFTMAYHHVASYVRDSVEDSSLALEVNSINQMVVRQGFKDFAFSQVFKEEENSLFFYPVLGEGRMLGQVNVCIPFFNPRNIQNKLGALIEGPALVGLYKFSKELQDRYYDPKRISDLLIPRRELQRGYGSFEEGYNNSTIFETNAGFVQIEYQSHHNDKTGTISLSMWRDVFSNINRVKREYYLRYA